MNMLTKQKWLVSVALVVMMMVFLAVSSQAVASEKVVMKCVTAFSKDTPELSGFWMFTDKVEKKLGSKIKIEYLGGNEVIPAFSLFEMLGKGAVDVAAIPANYAKPYLPIADTLHLTRLTPWKERENGAYDIWRNAFRKALKIEFLGHVTTNYPFQLYTNFEVKQLSDFAGKAFRSAPVTVPFLKALKAGPVSMPPGEIYSALERKVVMGYNWPTLGMLELGLAEVTKYRIDPGFYPVDVCVYFNSATWNKLPRDVRSEIENIMKDLEKDIHNYYAKKIIEDTEKQKKAGLTILQLPDGVAKEYLKIAYEAGWKEVLTAAPEEGAKVKALIDR
jgi:TRAP-type C4-dicarboxylate transport system substrate-binding protein